MGFREKFKGIIFLLLFKKQGLSAFDHITKSHFLWSFSAYLIIGIITYFTVWSIEKFIGYVGRTPLSWQDYVALFVSHLGWLLFLFIISIREKHRPDFFRIAMIINWTFVFIGTLILLDHNYRFLVSGLFNLQTFQIVASLESIDISEYLHLLFQSVGVLLLFFILFVFYVTFWPVFIVARAFNISIWRSWAFFLIYQVLTMAVYFVIYPEALKSS